MNSQQIAHIVFTKNRPLQLHGYLESLRRFFPAEAIQTYIIYKPDLFDAEYEACFASFPDCRVIRETNFNRDFMRLYDGIETEYVLFGVDDVAYFDSVSLDTVKNTFACLGEQLFGFSLRLDKRQMPRDITAGAVKDYDIDGQAIYTLDWTKGQTDNTRYPFELCATIYRTEDIRKLLAAVLSRNLLVKLTILYGRIFKVRKLYKRPAFFHNPNTLEVWCCRYVQNHPKLFGHLLAFQKICASAIQVNMVNNSTEDGVEYTPEMMVEALNEKYKKGYRVDIESLERNRPAQTHCGAEYFRLIKKVF